MPTIHEIKNSRFLTKADVTPPKKLTISGYEYINVAMESEKPDNQYVLNFVEIEKPMVLKSVNAELIALALGSEEIGDWINKEIVVYVDPAVTMKGKVVGGIRCRAVRKPAAAVPATPATPVTPPPAPKPVARPEPEAAEPEDSDVPF